MADCKKLIKSIVDIERICINDEKLENKIDKIYGICNDSLIGEFPLAEEIDKIAVEQYKIINEYKDNFPKMEMLLTNEIMKLQNLAEQLGKYYI